MSYSTPKESTFGELIEKVYRRLLSGQREQTVQITGGTYSFTPYGATTPSVGIDKDVTNFNVVGVQTGTLAIGAQIACGMEVMLVTEFSGTTGTANISVIRGYSGSDAEPHANGDLIFVNPKFTRYDIGVAINDDLMDLSSPTNGLFQVNTAKITYNPVYQGYDLGSAGVPKDFIDILDIRYRVAIPTHNFPPIKQWKVVRGIGDGISGSANQDSIFPSGFGVILYERGWPGLPLYVTYSAPFNTLVHLTDDVVSDSGLASTATDLPALGAEIDLTIPREIKRNFTEGQPDPRKSGEVPSGAISNSVQALILRREKRIASEADRLQRQYTRVRGW